jgi:peptidoglycan LD-endopeptidase CwlK
MDDVSELRLSRVHPKLADLIRKLSDQLALEGISIRVTQGLRSWEEQAALYAQGRTAPGPEVTKAPPGASYHNFGLAVDVVPMMPLGPDWNTGHPVWQRIISVGQSLGLVSGSNWRSFPDFPHFQLTGSLPVSPNDYVRAAYSEGGIDAVWTAAGMFVPPDPSGSQSA